jgi:hypothetical protein
MKNCGERAPNRYGISVDKYSSLIFVIEFKLYGVMSSGVDSSNACWYTIVLYKGKIALGFFAPALRDFFQAEMNRMKNSIGVFGT